jgi:hypothetical protein
MDFRRGAEENRRRVATSMTEYRGVISSASNEDGVGTLSSIRRIVGKASTRLFVVHFA